VNSKHNLSYNLSTSGTGSIKSVDTAVGGTSEVCVFCHTPHGGNTAVPLWNRSASVQSYVTYTSDVLAGLAYLGAENPNTHIKTKICLSCHDGTIALGSLVNLPYGVSSQIPMQGTTGAVVQYGMPNTAAGYIGLNLSDDHPVAIQHDNVVDTELVNGASVGAAVRLYTAAGNKVNANNNYVECTSCHEPHDNQYGKFLVETNQMSALCLKCHNKTKFPNSIHDTSSVGYSPLTGGTPAYLGNGVTGTVGDVKCMNCHFPHKAGVTTAAPTTPNPTSGKYLLSFQEEASCFNTGNDRWNTPGSNTTCHGSGAGAVAKNIETTENNNPNRRHYTGDVTRVGKHKATEGQAQGWMGTGNPNWHVECADCHNPHTAGNTSHTTRPPVPVTGVPQPPALTNVSSLYGTGGVAVTPTGAPAWPNGLGAYNSLEPIGVVDKLKSATGAYYEYQICLKCHSDFAWGSNTAPDSPSFSPAAAMTNQAREFSTAAFGSANQAYHPVMGVGINTQGTLNAPWAANKNQQTMYCSDCHNNNDPGATPPQGPHGSGNQFILAYPFDDTQTAKGTYQAGGDLCFICHDQTTYLTGAGAVTGFRTTLNTNLHTRHYTASTNALSNFGYKCVNCHIRVPHGWNARRAMVIIAGDAPASVYQLATGPSITGFGVSGWPAAAGVWPAAGNYQDGLGNKNANCLTVAGCHQFP
jgi:predicted CXXCH cytochrome family protein